jgi:SAM-dependent methyltransferase
MVSQYLGTDNLEVMEEAVNYSKFLVRLIVRELDFITSRNQELKALCVDFGAGIGTFAKEIVQRGLVVECVEPDLAQAALLRQGGFAVNASLAHYANDAIDCCYTFNVMEHIEDDIACFELMFQKMRAGGRLLVFVPAFQILYSSMDKKVGHLRRYTRRELGDKVGAAGFVVVHNDYIDSVGFFVTLLYRLIGSDSGSINRTALIVYDRLLFPLSRILDRFLGRLLGKNVFLVAEKPRKTK